MKIMNNRVKMALPLIAAMVMILINITACDQIAPSSGETFDFVIINDESGSHKNVKLDSAASSIHAKIMEEVGIQKDLPTSNGVRILYSYMGKSYLPEVGIAEIPAKAWELNPKDKRIREVNMFIDDSHDKLVGLLEKPAEDQMSNLYLGMINGLRQIDHSRDHRKLILLADMIESSVFLDMIERLKDINAFESNYEKMKEILIKAEPMLEEFSGTEVILICPEDYLATYHASKFWKWFYEGFGLSVSIRSTY